MNYSELQTKIAAWMKRSDLTAMIPTFIQFAEARFNRLLRVRQQETVFDSVALVDGAADLPDDFAEFKALWVDASPPKSLQVTTSEFIRSRPADANLPINYAIEGSSVICWPTAGNIRGIYYANIPALSDSNTTNWLLALAPDLYVYESLIHAEPYMKNDSRVMLWKTAADQIREELVSANRAQAISGGQLTVRVR